MVAHSRTTIRITVSLPEDDHSALTALAAKHDVSLSWLARQAVSEFLVRQEDGQLPLPLGVSD